jgi:hypothetical protein
MNASGPDVRFRGKPDVASALNSVENDPKQTSVAAIRNFAITVAHKPPFEVLPATSRRDS